jgi:GTP 3',8-cyclase
MLIDCYGRKINYLRVSVTDRCNLSCRYCLPIRGIINRPPRELLSFEEIVTIVEAAAQLGIENIRLTGGEPLVREDLATLVNSLNKVSGIKDISLTTNGILLGEQAADLKKSGLKRLNISLDSLRQDRYAWITRGGNLAGVLEGIKEAFGVGFSLIKINVLLLDEISKAEVFDFLRWTIAYPVHVRFLEFMPIISFYKTGRFISAEEVLGIARRFCDIEEAHLYGNGPARAYRLKHALGTFVR